MKTDFPGRILVTTDFSDASYKAFPYAAELAGDNQTDITLVNAVGFPHVVVSYEYLPSREEVDLLKSQAKTEAEERLQKLRSEYFAGVSTDTITLEGIGWSADTIVDYAVTKQFGTIVVATHGHGVLGRVFLGGFAERILRQAPCPVFVVPSRTEGHVLPAAHLPYRTIVMTTDFSESSWAALPIAQHEARRTKAKLTIAHVVEDTYPADLLREQRAMTPINIEEIHAHYFKGLEQKLNESPSEPNDQPIARRLIAKTHSVAHSITTYLADNDVDLLVISSRGAGTRFNILGGVIERILHHSPCPVLVVPPEGASLSETQR